MRSEFPLDQIETVNEVLDDVIDEYEVERPPTLLVVNKCDVADSAELAHLRSKLPHAVFVSAHTGQGFNELFERISQILDEKEPTVEFLVPYTDGDVLAQIYDAGKVIKEEHGPDGTSIKARVPKSVANELELFRV